MADQNPHHDGARTPDASGDGNRLAGFAEPIPLKFARDHAELLRDLVEHLPAGAVYVGRERLCLNRAAEEMTGYQRSELRTFDDWFSSLHPDGDHEIRELYDSHRTTGFTDPVTFDLRRKDGETRTVEFAAHRFDEYEVWLLHDITERASAEKMLLESRGRLQAVLDTAAEAIITIDGGGIVASINQAGEEMFGYAADELIGRNVSVLMPAPYRDAHSGYIERYLRTGQATVIGIGRETVARHKDGSIFPIELAISEIGHLQLFTGIIRDISERKETEERLQQADRLSAIGTLAAGLGHDMNNILLPVRARLDLIEGSDLPPAIREHFVEIRKSARYLQDLADGLHLLVLDPDDSEASTESTSIDRWWEQVHSLLSRLLPKHVRFSASIPSDLPEIPVAPHRLTQAILNMLVNAGKAVGEDGKVRLWADCDRDNGIVRLCITDNGCGMTEEVKRRVFEPFYTTKTRGLGTGLGLSLVRGVVQSAGGAVDIESEPGRGTTITLMLPIVATLTNRDSPNPGGFAPHAIVELEDKRSESLVVDLLEMAGFDVTRSISRSPHPAFVCVTTTSALSSGSVRECADNGCMIIALGPADSCPSHPNICVIENPNDFDELRAAVDRAAAGA